MENNIVWDFIEFWIDEDMIIIHTLFSKQWFEIYNTVIDFSKCGSIIFLELNEIYKLSKMYTQDKNIFLNNRKDNNDSISEKS